MGNMLEYGNKVIDPVEEDQNSGLGPIGKGDPDDTTLRPREILVNIPHFQEKAASMMKCRHFKEEEDKCLDDSFSSFSCRKEAKQFSECVEYWMTDSGYRDQLTQEYLLIRQEYRKTGRRRLFRALKGQTYVAPDKLKGFQV